MKKKLLFILSVFVFSVLFVSCSKDNSNNDTDLNPIVPTTTGAITHAGVDFRHGGLTVESATIVASESLTKSTTRDIAMRMAFNDNVEVIVIAENFPSDQKITIDNAYYTFLKYGTKVRFNLIENLGVKASETFSVPMGSLTSLFDEEINTLALDFKNKYEYKGEITLPETPEIEVPEIVEPTDIPTILQSTTWKSESTGFLNGTLEQDEQVNPFYLVFYQSTVRYCTEPGEASSIVKYPIKYNDNGFVMNDLYATYHYTIKSITTTEVHLTYEYYRENGHNYDMNIDIVLKKYIKPQ